MKNKKGVDTWETQHTPGPGKLFSLSHGDFKKELYISEDNPQATPILSLGDMDVNSKAYRDAIFAVQAVNHYENLLSNLKLAESRLTGFCDSPDKDGNVIAPDSFERVVLRQIRQVIAKATKGE